MDDWSIENKQWAPSGIVRIVSAGRLQNSQKGYDLGLRGLGAIQSQDKLGSFSYQIAGAGPDEERLRGLAAELNLSDKVQFLGWLEANEIQELLQHGDVFLHPARIEPYGVVVLEAMAKGLVVVGSDACGSIADRIEHGKNGLCHSAGNVEEIRRDLCSLLRNQSMLPRLGSEARRTAEKWPVSKAIGILTKVLCSPKNASTCSNVTKAG